MAESGIKQDIMVGGTVGSMVGLVALNLASPESWRQDEAARDHLYDLREKLANFQTTRDTIPSVPIDVQPGAYRFVDGLIQQTQTEITAAKVQVESTRVTALDVAEVMGGAMAVGALATIFVARAGRAVGRYWKQRQAVSSNEPEPAATELAASPDSSANAG